jgi:hypothetical protein
MAKESTFIKMEMFLKVILKQAKGKVLEYLWVQTVGCKKDSG